MIARLLILICRLWQLGPSAIMPPTCRFSPSCSAYAIEALRRYGAAKGGWLAVRRIARCHPWGDMGTTRSRNAITSEVAEHREREQSQHRDLRADRGPGPVRLAAGDAQIRPRRDR